MKRYLILLVFLIGCSGEKPDNLIEKEKMENIIFDIMILNGSSGFDLKIDNKYLSDELIYQKYDIDSAQFYESELYYSKNPRIQYEIYANVKLKILKSIDSLKNSY